jgi:hypothetical protein
MVKRIGPNGAPVEVKGLLPEIEFAPWSLKNNKRWTSKDVVRDVFEQLDPNAFDFNTLSVLDSALVDFPIENLEIDDAGHDAVARILSFFPGISLYVDYAGKIKLYDTRSRQEGSLIPSLGPEIIGQGHVNFVDFTGTRPKKIHVLFTRELEVRFDFDETATASTIVPGQTNEQRIMENVLPVPDPSLTLADGSVVVQGTYITFDQALEAWNLAQNTSLGAILDALTQGGVTLTKKIIREAWVTGGWFTLYSELGRLDPNADWAARLGAIQAHYRQTFRINRVWTDKLRSIRAERLAILDQATGARGPAQVYSDYSVMPNLEKAILFSSSADAIQFIVNIDAFTEDIQHGSRLVGKIASARISPALVQVLDGDQGIIRVEYRKDPFNMFNTIFPSKIDGANSIDPKRSNDVGVITAINAVKDKDGKPIKPSASGAVAGTKNPEDLLSLMLSEEFRLSVILSCVAGAPNSNEQLHRVTVNPGEVIGGEAGNGPEWEIRIGMGVETARFAWDDEKWQETEKAFGVGITPEALAINPPNLEPLLINGGIAGQGNINAFAKATASRIYFAFKNRLHGSKTVRMLPDVPVVGSISQITHSLASDGAATTTIELAPELEPVNPFALLPDSVRRVMLRQVNDERQK